MRVFRNFSNFFKKEMFFSGLFVYLQEDVGKPEVQAQTQTEPEPETEEKLQAVTEAEAELGTLEKEIVAVTAERELSSLKNEIREAGVPPMDSLLQENKIEIQERVNPKTSLVQIIMMLVSLYLRKKPPSDVTGKAETWEDAEGLAADMFKDEAGGGGGSAERFKKHLVEHKCNSSEELERAISRNNNLEFDVVWDSASNQFIVQHNFVSGTQDRFFTCNQAYDVMKGKAWTGEKCIIDIKDRMGIKGKVDSPFFQNEAYFKIKSLLKGMPGNFKEKLYLATFDPYTEAAIVAFKSVAEKRGGADAAEARNIKIMSHSMSTMSYGIDDTEARGVLGFVQNQAPWLVGFLQGPNAQKDGVNNALASFGDRDGNGRSDTKIHSDYEQYDREADDEANNVIAMRDPILARAMKLGGEDRLRERIESGLVISLNDDIEYLKHIVSNLDSDGRYYGVRPEDISVFGVENANELHDVLFVAHQRGRKWAMVIHDVPEGGAL